MRGHSPAVGRSSVTANYFLSIRVPRSNDGSPVYEIERERERERKREREREREREIGERGERRERERKRACIMHIR